MGDKDITEATSGGQPITRKEAIQKVGRYAAFTAAAMMLILEPVKGQPSESPVPPGLKKAQKKAPKNTPPPSF